MSGSWSRAPPKVEAGELVEDACAVVGVAGGRRSRRRRGCIGLAKQVVELGVPLAHLALIDCTRVALT